MLQRVVCGFWIDRLQYYRFRVTLSVENIGESYRGARGRGGTNLYTILVRPVATAHPALLPRRNVQLQGSATYSEYIHRFRFPKTLSVVVASDCMSHDAHVTILLHYSGV